jgi:hypothetical protein
VPALGGGYGARERVVLPRVRPRPGPVGVLAPAKPSLSLRSSPFGQPQPFHQALQQAHERVQHAQAALPKQPMPHLPYVANPTPAQARAALTVALHSQRQALGPNPGAARIRQYRQELANDPRQRQYLATVEHFARALAAHEAPPSGIQPRAERAPAPSGLGSLPLIGTASNYLGQRAAEDIPAIVSVGSAIGKLATGNVAGEPSPSRSVLSNALIDLAQLPAGVISSVVQTGAAGVDAAKGNTAPGEAILKGLAQTVEHPIAALRTRPVSTLLTLAGGEEAAGRLAGAVARTGRLGKTAARLASTERAPLGLYNDMAVKRYWNPAIDRKALQVLADKARASPVLLEARRQLDPNQATGVRLQRAIQGGLTRPGEVDISVAGGEQMRRSLKADALRQVAQARPKHGADAVPLIVERVIRRADTVEADLRKEAVRLQAAQRTHGLTGAELAGNKANLQIVEGLLGDRRFLEDPAPAFAAAQHFIDSTAPLTRSLQRVGHFSPHQVQRAPLFPYAQAHLGARYFTEADHAAAESQAAAVEHEAQARLAQLEPGTPEHAHAMQEVLAARGHRFEVSGRGAPELQAAHEQTVAEHQQAARDLAEAQGRVRQVENARSRLVGAYGRARPSQDARAAQGSGSALDAADARLRGAREALQAAKAREVQTRQAVEPQPPIRAGLRTAEGKYLPTEAIVEHMRANGVEPPGFLTHEAQLGNRQFFRSTTRRPGVASRARTGSSFAKGAYRRDYKALAAQASDLANVYAAHHATDARLGRFGIGRYASLEDAVREAENFSHTPEGERIVNGLGPLVPAPIGPERVRAAGRVAPGAAEAARARFGVEQHKPVEEASQLQGKWTLLPQTVVDRLKEHDALLNPGRGKRLAQKVTNQWRQTALFTSPRWLLGSPQEHGIRLAIGGAAPKFLHGRSGRFGTRVANAYDEIALERGLDAEAARLAHAELVKGTLYGAAEALQLHRAADQFQSSPVLGPALDQTERAKGSAAGNVVLAPWRAWHRFVANGMVHLERESRRAALGKIALQEIHRFNGRWTNVNKLTDEQVKAYARGTLTPKDTAYLVRQVDEMMGAYGHLTPTVRNAVQTWSPFGLWLLTSYRYLRRLPLDHPTKTAVLAVLHNAVASNERQGSEPAYLKGGIHVNLPLGLGGATLTPTYYSPAGVSIEPIKTAAAMVAPLETETVGAGLGLDTFTGKTLTAPHGVKGEASEGQRPGIILQDLLGGLVPGYRQATQLREMDGTPYSTSTLLSPTVKPGTRRDLPHTLLKLLSPERLTYDPGAGRAVAPLTPEDQQALRESAGTSAFDQAEVARIVRESEGRR